MNVEINLKFYITRNGSQLLIHPIKPFKTFQNENCISKCSFEIE